MLLKAQSANLSRSEMRGGPKLLEQRLQAPQLDGAEALRQTKGVAGRGRTLPCTLAHSGAQRLHLVER